MRIRDDFEFKLLTQLRLHAIPNVLQNKIRDFIQFHPEYKIITHNPDITSFYEILGGDESRLREQHVPSPIEWAWRISLHF